MHSILSSVEFQMSLLLFVALAGYLLVIRINQSAVIGAILVGLLIGPSCLKLITYTEFVESLAHLGAVVLLFVVGLEFKLKDIFSLRYGIVALAGVIVPWIGGYLTAKYFGYDTAAAIFTGTALTATSIAITAKVLQEMGKLQTEAARAIIGAAVIDDILGLLALSLSKQAVDGTLSWDKAVIPLLTATAFFIISIIVGKKILCPLIERIENTRIARQQPEFTFIMVMATAFLYAMLAEMFHLSAIVGAFAAGLSLEGVRSSPGQRDFKEGAEYLNNILGPIFFVSLGILVDLSALSLNVVLFFLVLTVVAMATKWIGCSLAAMLQGLSFKDGIIVGLGMAPRGEVAMIVGLIGLNQKLITQDIYTAIIFMSLLTTILVPILLKPLFK